MRAALALVAILAAALPKVAWAACVPSGGVDLCALARDTADTVAVGLPRELAPGIRAEMAVPGGDAIELRLMVAADLRLPDENGFARLVCADPDLARFVQAGGSVALELNRRILAVIATCAEVN